MKGIFLINSIKFIDLFELSIDDMRWGQLNETEAVKATATMYRELIWHLWLDNLGRPYRLAGGTF